MTTSLLNGAAIRRWNGLGMLLLSLLAGCAAAAQTPAQPPRGEIAGRVRRASNGLVIRTATVRLLAASDESVVGSMLTGDEGAYHFGELPPGVYILEVSAQSFATRRFAADPKTRLPLRISGAGEKIQLDAELQTLGRISGRVLDERGEGLVGAVVWAVARVVATEKGLAWRQLTVASGGGTDDEGQFRIGNLLPGEYFLYAMPATSGQSGAGFSGLPHGAKRALDGYYPHGRSIDEARAVTLLAGEMLEDLTIQLDSAPGYCAKGTIVGGEGGSRDLRLVNAVPDRAPRGVRNPISVLTPKPGAQEFELCGLPGEPLSIELFGPTPDRISGRTTLTPRKEGGQEFRLEATAVFPVQVQMKLQGETARWCGRAEPVSSACYDTGAVRFRLQSAYTYIFMNPSGVKEEPGVWTMDRVFQSQYRTVLELPPGLYVKAARLGLQALEADDPFLLDGSARRLEFTLAESQAKVQVELRDTKDFSGTVYLVPTGSDASYWRHIVTVPITQGAEQGEVAGVAPGEYEAMLVSGDNPAAAIAAIRAGGGFPRVRVEAGRVARVELSAK